MSKLSLWLEPERETAFSNRAGLSIRVLAETPEFDPFVTFIFAPHVTVIGTIQAVDESRVVALTQDLAKSFDPLNISFIRVGFEDNIVRAAYLMAEQTDELKHFCETAETLFKVSKAEYPRHMSLFYSDQVGEARRRKAVADLNLALPMRGSFSRLALWRTPLNDGKPDFAAWARVMEVPLQNG